MANRFSSLRSRAASGLFTAAILLMLVPTESHAFPNVRSLMSRARNQQKQQHDQMVKTLQAQNEQGKKMLVTAEQEQASAASELQSSKSQYAAAKENTEAKQADLRTATQNIKDLEEKILASQAPDSEYGKALADQARLKMAADEIMYQLLSLPPRTEPLTDKERALELVKLSADKKAKLKASADFTKANQLVETAHDRVVSIQKKVLEQNSEWKSATNERHSLQQDLKSLQASEKSAHSAMSASQRKASEANEQVSSLQQGMMEIRSELANMGAPVK